MSGLELWLKSTTANSIFSALSATEAKTEFVKSRDFDVGFNPYELSAIAYEAPDPPGQMKIVKLFVAIRNLRYHRKQGRRSKREMDLRNETDLSHVVFEFNTALADDQDCLWCDVLAPIRGGGCIRPESNYEWITFNAFLARLASVDDALIFNTSVSAAAQYMIYSASKVFEFCEREPTLLLQHLGWKKWKAGFEMNEAEVGWDSYQMLRNFDQAKPQVLCSLYRGDSNETAASIWFQAES